MVALFCYPIQQTAYAIFKFFLFKSAKFSCHSCRLNQGFITHLIKRPARIVMTLCASLWDSNSDFVCTATATFTAIDITGYMIVLASMELNKAYENVIKNLG